MAIYSVVSLTVKDADDYNRVLEFVKPDEDEAPDDDAFLKMADFIKLQPKEEQCALMCRHCSRLSTDFNTSPETRSFSWSGAEGYSWAFKIAEEVARHFKDISFRICWLIVDSIDYQFGWTENGEIKWVEMSSEMRETINEMLYYQIDVDPYAGPTPENLHQLQLCRWDDSMEQIKTGSILPKVFSLQMKDRYEFRRVLEYVKPDESETVPQSREEYGQVTDYVATLSGAERFTWMTRHCARLNVKFGTDPENLLLQWSGYLAMGNWAKEIAERVVAQFPDIGFRVSFLEDPYYSCSKQFGVSEQGQIIWLPVSDDVIAMLEAGIDVDPYAGPTPENQRQLRVFKANSWIAENREGHGMRPFASLKTAKIDDFHRVLEFVAPDGSDRNPQDGEEYVQVWDYLDTLDGTERCAWMTKHCARLYISFDKNEDKQRIAWSGPSAFGHMAMEIAESVVSLFPDIRFHICENHYFSLFGQSENGCIKWLELSPEEKNRMLEEEQS